MVEIKSFKLPRFKRPTNPLSDEGMKALAIVLGAIALTLGAFCLAEFKERQESVVLPAKVEVERTAAPKTTEAPTTIPEEVLEATASPMLEVTASPSAQF